MSSILDWVTANGAGCGFNPTKIVARGISTGGYYAMRVAYIDADRLFTVVAQGGACHHMFDPEWIGAQDQVEYSLALLEALAYKFGYRGADPVQAYAVGTRKFSLLDCGLLDRTSRKLLVINGHGRLHSPN